MYLFHTTFVSCGVSVDLAGDLPGCLHHWCRPGSVLWRGILSSYCGLQNTEVRSWNFLHVFSFVDDWWSMNVPAVRASGQLLASNQTVKHWVCWEWCQVHFKILKYKSIYFSKILGISSTSQSIFSDVLNYKYKYCQMYSSESPSIFNLM